MILLGAAVLVATAACSSTVDNPVAVATTTTAAAAPIPTVAPTPTAAPTPTIPSVVDVSLRASAVLTDGSVGIRKGTTKLTILNKGNTTPAITLVFNNFPVNVTPDGPFWTACHPTDDGRTLNETCQLGTIALGGQATYMVGFANINLGQMPSTIGKVTVTPTPGPDLTPADNSVNLTICTNGCSFDQTN
jgi:hypothetical protein